MTTMHPARHLIGRPTGRLHLITAQDKPAKPEQLDRRAMIAARKARRSDPDAYGWRGRPEHIKAKG